MYPMYRSEASTNFLFVYNHLLPNNSFLHILYFGKKCKYLRPHIDIYAFGFICVFLLWIISLIFLVVGLSSGIELDEPSNITRIDLVISVLIFAVFLLESLYTAFEMKKYDNEFKKLDQESLDKIKKEILDEYPDYFK